MEIILNELYNSSNSEIKYGHVKTFNSRFTIRGRNVDLKNISHGDILHIEKGSKPPDPTRIGINEESNFAVLGNTVMNRMLFDPDHIHVVEPYEMIVFAEYNDYYTANNTLYVNKIPNDQHQVLVLICPSQNRGGGDIYFGPTRMKIEPDEVTYVLFRPDEPHRVMPVTRNHQVCFVFRVYEREFRLKPLVFVLIDKPIPFELKRAIREPTETDVLINLNDNAVDFCRKFHVPYKIVYSHLADQDDFVVTVPSITNNATVKYSSALHLYDLAERVYRLSRKDIVPSSPQYFEYRLNDSSFGRIEYYSFIMLYAITPY